MTDPQLPYPDRVAGGRAVAEALRDYAGRDDVLVLGLPRGGVVTAEPIAEALDAPLDVLVVRKLGVPGREELAMGAIATGGARVLHETVVQGLAIDADTVEAATQRERKELERREVAYRGNRSGPRFQGQCVILVDDGLATGSTVRAAAAALREHQPSRIVVAVPVAPSDTLMRLQAEVDEVVCPAVPEPFFGVGQWYSDFEQTTDDQVRSVLTRAWARNDANQGRSESRRND